MVTSLEAGPEGSKFSVGADGTVTAPKGIKAGDVELGSADSAMSTDKDGITLVNKDNDAKGAVLTMKNNRGSSSNDGKANDVLGEIRFFGNDDAATAAGAKANDTEYATIQASISDATNPNGEEG